MRRASLLVAPAVIAVAAMASQACSSSDDSPPPIAQVAAVADARASLVRDVAWVASATKRCSAPGAGPTCLNANAGTTTSSLRPLDGTGSATGVTLGLDLICAAVAAAFSGGGGGGSSPAPAPSSSSSSGSPTPDAGTSPSATPILQNGFYFTGGPVTLDGAAPAGASPSADVVWDLTHAQAAAFVHPQGGIGALVALPQGYGGNAAGTAPDVIGAWQGAFELAPGDTPDAASRSVRRVGSDLLATVAGATPLSGLPTLATALLAGKSGYFAWDDGTTALAKTLPGSPTLAGGAGARYLQFSVPAGNGAGTPPSSGATAAVSMMVAGGDPGDFSTPAGQAALGATAAGTSATSGVGLDSICAGMSGAPGYGGYGSSGSSGATKNDGACIFAPGSCPGGTACIPNGGGTTCCRPPATGTQYCLGGDRECTGGLVCTERDDGHRVCAPRATCR